MKIKPPSTARRELDWSHPFAKDLVAYWPMLRNSYSVEDSQGVPDSTLTTTEGTDWSGNGLHLTPNSGGTTQVPLVRGAGLSFDGSNDVIGNDNVDNVSNLTSGSEDQPPATFMIDCYMNNPGGGLQFLMGHGRNNSTYGRYIRFGTNDLVVAGEYNNTGGTYQMNNILNAAGRYVIAVRFGTDSACAVNGHIAGTGAAAKGYGAYGFGIGAARYAGANTYYPANIIVYSAYVSNLALTNEELVYFTKYPYCLLRPARRYFFTGAADLRLASGSTSVTESGVLTQKAQIVLPANKKWVS